MCVRQVESNGCDEVRVRMENAVRISPGETRLLTGSPWVLVGKAHYFRAPVACNTAFTRAHQTALLGR